MPGRDVKLKASDGGLFDGDRALPSRSPAPGIVLLQEIYGVNASMHGIADEFADKGYLVIVPDLFWRQRRGVQLDPGNPTDRDSAMQLLDEALAIEDAAAAVRYVRGLPESSGKVAAV
jgi:carboxymethylenebutenolidase